MSSSNLLPVFLSAAVPLHMDELQRAEGPSPADYAAAQAFVRQLAEQGDQLLYRSAQPGHTARLANDLAHAVAVLAFRPGGVKIFGQHYAATSPCEVNPMPAATLPGVPDAGGSAEASGGSDADASPRPAFVIDAHLTFLDDLRASGQTNMFGAAPFLQRAFAELSTDEARQTLRYWMQTFAQRQGSSL